MSYNYYCYGQVKDDKGWKDFLKDPLSDGLKYLIDFDDVPSCFERVSFENSDFDRERVAPYFMDKYRPEEYCRTEGYFVRLDKFIDWYRNKIKIINAQLSILMKCFGLEIDDIDFTDSESIDEIIYRNEEKRGGKSTLPIAKNGLFELMKCIAELRKCERLLGIADVFQSLSYDSLGIESDRRSFLIVME